MYNVFGNKRVQSLPNLALVRNLAVGQRCKQTERKVACASLQIGPLDRSSPLTAQMTRRGSVYVLLMVSLIKNIFPFFHPKM